MGEVCTKAQLIDFVKGSLVHSIPTLLTRSSAAQVSRAILQEGEHNRGQFTLPQKGFIFVRGMRWLASPLAGCTKLRRKMKERA